MNKKNDTDLEELERLEEKSKNGNGTDEDHKKIMVYRFALRLIPADIYWAENCIG